VTLRAVLADDEPLARTRLRRLLAEHPEVEIAGEAGDGLEACRVIDDVKPDLVFLDVQMPGLSGFDVLANLRHRPRVIFVTAHDEFAVRAFDEQALDFLVKPVEPARLARAIARLQGPGAEQRAADDQARLRQLLDAVAKTRTPPRRIAVRRGATVTLVEPESILFCRAEDKYTVLHTAEGEHIADRTIEELEAALPDAFLRIHRSTIVNLAVVRDLTSVEGGRFTVTLKDGAGTKLYASRSGAKLLREKLGF
jgi:two-component system, LytTR family, response regulator